MTDRPPLIIGPASHFFRTDLHRELWLARVSQHPMAVFGGDGPVTIRADLLPVEKQIVAIVEAAKVAGRTVVLAEDLPEALKAPISLLHGLEIIDESEADPAALDQRYGTGHWELAPPIAAPMPQFKTLMRPLRPHQWVKNILLFLPVLAAHAFEWSTLALALLGFVAFCAAASAIYIVNDLLDLEADRLHVTKHKRPFAAGAVPLGTGMAMSAGLAALALLIGVLLGPLFLLIVGDYMILSLLYSIRLKRLRWVDIVVLATLYTLRAIGGAAAAEVDTSLWLLSFIFPVFLALGAVKRLTEVTLAKTDAKLPGRGYARQDRGLLLNFAIASVIVAVVMYLAYSMSPQAERLYPDRLFLQLAMLPIAWWLIRMVRLGYHGKQDHDPIVFAMRDRRGLGLIMIALSLMFWGAGLWQKWFGI